MLKIKTIYALAVLKVNIGLSLRLFFKMNQQLIVQTKISFGYNSMISQMTKSAKYFFQFLFMILLAGTASAQSTQLTHEDSLNVVLKKYYELNLKVFQANSQPEDIDNIFDLFTADFEYIHPHYGGTYTRQDLYEGYQRNQKNGGYDGSVTDIKILNKIVGLNAVAVSKSFVTTKDGEVTIGEVQMTMFEFRDGKISRIYEYW